MKLNLPKLFSGIVIAVYVASIVLPGSVFATPAPISSGNVPPAKHEPKRGINPETGKVSFIGAGDPINVPGVTNLMGMTSQDRALSMASIYGSEFGLKNPSQELKLLKSKKDDNGNDIVHYQQMYEGVPVIASSIIVNMNAKGELLSISGEVSSDFAIDTNPAIKAQAARQTALSEIAGLYELDEKELVSTDPELSIFDESLLTASTRPAELVWHMEVTTQNISQPIREMILVNARTGELSFHINQVGTQTTTWPVYFDIELDEARGWIYGSDSTGNKIDVISMSTLALVKSFILVNGSTPKCIALSPDGNELAIAQFGASSILFLNPDTGATIATVFPNTTYTKAPWDLLYGRSGRLYTSGASDYYVHVIDTVSHTEVSRSPLNTSLFGTRLAISADKNWLYASRGSGSPYKLFKYNISSDTIPTPIVTPDTSGLTIGAFTLDPVKNLIFTDTGQVWPASLKGFVGSTNTTGQSAYIPFRNAVAFASNSNNIIFVSTENFYKLSAYPLQGPMGPIVSQADGNKVFVSTSNGIVSVDLTNFPPGTPGTFPTGSLPYFDVVLDEPRGVLYGSSVLGHKIDVISIDTLQVVDQIRLNNGSQPNGMDLSPDGNELAVAATAANSVVFINTNTRTISATVMPNMNGAIRPFDVKYGRAGRLYSSGAGNGIDYLHVFDTTTHTEVGSSLYPNIISSAPYLSISADKNLVYANEAPQVVSLFDVSTDSPVILTSTDNTFQGKNSILLTDNSKLFTSAGQVWLSNLFAKIGSFNASGNLVEIPGQNLVAVISSANPGQITFVKTGDFYTASTASIPLISSVGASTVSSAGDKLFVNTNAGIKVLDIAPANSSSLSISSGSPQSVQVSTQFQDPLKVRVQNVTGTPMQGALVTFTAPATGASGIFGDTNSTVTTAVTDANGIATSSILTANNIVGTYSVRATVPGLAAYSAFQLTNFAAVNCTISKGTDPDTLFLTYRQFNCGSTGHGAVVGDFNHDDRKDVALSAAGALLVFLQDTDGSLLQPRAYGSASDDLAAGDVNHDGLDDVISADSPSNTIAVFLQRNDGTLAYRVTYSTSTNPDAIAVGDLNSDGLKDVVVSHWNSAVIGVFTQNPNGTLNPMVTYPSAKAGYDDIAIGDVNNDGRNDVVKMNGQLYANPNLQVYLQSTSGTLGTAVPYSIGCSCMGSGIGIGDVTGDGLSDVVMSYGGNRPNAKIAVFTQDSSGNLQSPVSYISYDIPEPVEIADVNSDNLMDVVTLHSAWQRAGVFQQQPNGTLGAEALYSLPYSSYNPEDLSVGDINADGLPDLVIADLSGLVVLYRNTVIPPTPSPSPTNGPTYTPGPTFTAGPGPSLTPRPSSTAGPSPTPVPSSSTGRRKTYTASGAGSIPGMFLCDQNQLICTDGADPDADKAHQYAADTFVFYNTHHGRNSFDDQGSTIISTVHYGIGYQNAFWDGYQMVYGDGMAADDVVGHEITHGVTEYTSGLIYSYESGAINESFSDVWGEFIDQTNNSGNDALSVKWLMGEDSALAVIRSMSNPPTYGDPDKMSSPYYYVGSGDNGGVHINSGVNNKAAYLMVEGGTFNDRTIIGIGLDKTAAVYYETQVNHLTMGANYNDLYYALIQACQNLVGGTDGITEADCEQVRIAAEAVEMIPPQPPTSTPTPLYTFQPSTPTGTSTKTTTPSPTPFYTFLPNTPTPTRTRTPTPTRTPTCTPTSTATVSPTGTETTTPTRIPTYDPTVFPAGDILRASVDSGGVQGNNDSYFPAISADGRYIVFNSHASNLVPGDTNGVNDIFVHDMQTNLTTRVSLDSNGMQGNDHSYRPVVSADGRYIAFDSDASNLVAGDINGNTDVFVHDRQTGVTKRVSVRSNGWQGFGTSLYPSISADGRYVAFYSSAADLAENDTNLANDVFLHDRQTGETRRISAAFDGVAGDNDSLLPSISADGRYIAFESEATNLIAGDTNGVMDIFRYDSLTGQTLRVSVDSYESQANGYSGSPSIAADGSLIAFESAATNLVSGDTNAHMDIFLRDTSTGTTTRVSVDSNGLEANHSSYDASISGNGQYIAFDSAASNLVPGDSNRQTHAFVHDRELGKTTRFSVSSIYGQGNGQSDQIVVSADGQFLAFTSWATNLVPNDTNLRPDVFVYRQTILPLPLTPTSTVTASPTGTAAAGTPTRTPTVVPAFNSRTTTGVFRPSNGALYLKNSNDTGFADIQINYGLAGDYPVVGDWDGNGTVTIGIYRNGNFYLRNENTIGFADIVFPFGALGDQPVAGDWDGDGVDTIGVYRHGIFYLRNSNDAGAPEMIFSLGITGDVGIAGDWNGDGIDTTGVFRPSNGALYLKNKNETGYADIQINYGLPGDKPVTGDWDGDGDDTIGIYRNGAFYLRNENTIGFADLVFALGVNGDMPIAGNWDGQP